MSFTHAILRVPGPNFASGLTTVSSSNDPPDYARILGQHAAYAGALQGLGLQLTVLEPLPAFPDAYFVEDVAVITPEVAVVTRPGAPERRGEEQPMAPVLAHHRSLASIEAPGTLDGGDVLIVERTVFVGLSNRTNEEGAAQLERALSPHGYKICTVPVDGGLHLKSSVNTLGGRQLLLSESLAGRPELRSYPAIVVDRDEEYASNTLWINGSLLTPRGFPKTLRKLRQLGLSIVELDTSELRKMDGGLTCMSLRF